MTKKIFTTLLAITVAAGTMFAANPKREMRSTWFTTVWGIDWPSTTGTSETSQAAQKNQMISFLDNLEALNMTGTCFQVRSMGDAMYPSQYAPWSSYVSGTRGVDPGWDPLAFFVEEAHKRGLEAYVWLNPYRWTSGTDWETAMDEEWKNNNMLIPGTNNPNYITFNPALPETRQLIVNVIKEILNNYNIDGVLFDDYFYASGGTAESSSAPDYSHYKASGTTMSIGDWRRRNVNDMVADSYNAIKELRPDVRFGISPAGVSSKSASKYGLSSPSSYGVTASDWQYAQIYSDPLAWMSEKTIDFISPQCYWLTTHGSAPFGPLTKWWSYAAKELGVHYYASHSVSYIASADNQSSWIELAKQISFNREYVENNACGSVYYSTKNLTTGTRNHLKNDVYSTPALTPEITWKSGTNYGEVANLAYNNGTLSWDATKNGNAIIRYTVYAVPHAVSFEQAQAADGDGIDVQYLQKVVYGTSYTLAPEKQGNYWYAVHVFDGYGKEHTATILNYPNGESETTVPVSPVGGTTAEWVTTFSWSEIDNATFSIEIAEDNTFSKIIYSEKNIKENSTTIDLGILSDSKTYYWHVRTSQSGKLESVSETATFKAPTRTAGPIVTLTSPVNGAEIEDECFFVWKGAGNADVEKYTIEISASSDFSTLKYSGDIDAVLEEESVSHTIPASLLGKGTFHWRVLTKGSHFNTGVSESRSFTITKLSVGNFEPGYEIKYDNDSYSDAGSLKVENVWMRSILSDYNNIVFESNGSFNRGMCVSGDYVYVSGRSENSSGANTYLRKYSINTGEHMGDLKLGEEVSIGYYPCNDVIKDSKGNVCVTNLTLGANSTPLKIFLVNLETGAVTQVASVATSKNVRLDHVALWGDVSTGNFKIYAAIRESLNVVRWTFENGSQTKEETTTVKDVYSGSHFGTAPTVTVIDENSILIDGATTPMTRYNFSTGAMEDSFKNNTALAPEQTEGNGCTFFTLNNKKYVLYSYGDDGTDVPWTFNVVSTDDNMSFSSMKLLWTLPKKGLGNVYSGTMHAPVDYANIDNNTVRIFMYVPGCGLCAYDITDTSISGIENTMSEDTYFTIKARGNNIIMSDTAQSVSVYDLTGAQVAHAVNTAEMTVNLASGIYIVSATVNGNVHTQKIIIK